MHTDQLRASDPGKVDFKLYPITDRRIFPAGCSLYLAVESVLEAGAGAVQLREKDLSVGELLEMAVWMRELTDEFGAKLIVNDRVDVALSAGADGVHLGRDSVPVSMVRKIAGDRLLVGVSTHGVEEAIEAEKDGADFITLGPIYRTPSKLKYGNPLGLSVIGEVKKKIAIPVFAIGGVNPDRIKELREAGADGVAAISALFTAKDVREAAENILRLMR